MDCGNVKTCPSISLQESTRINASKCLSRECQVKFRSSLSLKDAILYKEGDVLAKHCCAYAMRMKT